MANKRGTVPGGEAEFSGGGVANNDTGDLKVKVRFSGTGGGMSSVENPVNRAVTITIPTRVVRKLLLSGGLHLHKKNTTVKVPIETGDRVTVRWA